LVWIRIGFGAPFEAGEIPEMSRSFLRTLNNRWTRAIGVSTVLAATWFLWWNLPPRPIRLVEVPDTQLMADLGSDGEVKIAKDGRTVFRSEVPGLAEDETDSGLRLRNLFRFDLETGFEQVLFHSRLCHHFKISPDEKTIALVKGNDEIDVIDAKSGRKRFAVPTPPRSTAIEFSADGHTLAVASIPGGTEGWSIFDAQSGIEKCRIPGSQFDLWLSSDGNRAIIHSAKDRSWLNVYDARGGRLIAQFQVPDGMEFCPSPDLCQAAFRKSKRGANEKPPYTIVTTIRSIPDMKVVVELTSVAERGIVTGRWDPAGRYFHCWHDAGGIKGGGSTTGREIGQFWDLAVDPPSNLDDLIPARSYGPRFSSDGAIFSVEQCARPKSRWTFYDSQSRAVLASREATADHTGWGFRSANWVVSPNREWVIMEEDIDVPEQPWMPDWAARWVEPRLGDEFAVTAVSLTTGRATCTVPGFKLLGFGVNSESFWTISFLGSDNGNGRLFQWSVHPPRPPWWLWLATAGGVGVVCWDVRRWPSCRYCLSFDEPKPATAEQFPHPFSDRRIRSRR